MTNEDIEKIADDLEVKSAQEVLEWAIGEYPKIALASSFGAEDVVLVDILVKIKPDATIFTLDTGRLNEETYDVMERVRKKYNINIKSYSPDTEEVEKLEREDGFYSFRDSIDARRQCCNIRKVQLLKRAMSGLDAWITGLRREQAVTRTELKKIEYDEGNNIVKLNPIADWTQEEVWNYIKENDVPYNALHDKGFLSIGCSPCTRAIKEGEDVRAGRWWWENPEQKECGLHH
ncbi:MAG: phosphoadenylyl-sulfate reductase [Candidatus Altiarchaeota archaeon]|nr:phosphoadenylyl-sulfate reductase [Candidatus Altiarchaeota archaeon]MBU4341676.1 phosphoadenylyl-sulfate reductase [Candidatus Altiarchaeota archaeon]